MLYFLENDNYKAGVDTVGAELHHFIKKDEQLELIWQADTDVWASHAPNLFPIVGELPNQQYTFKDSTYDMKRHGFARRKEFKLVDEQHDKLVFELTEDEETLQHYPFHFRFLVAYTLDGSTLSVSYHITNTSELAMYFSVGGHPGFRVPFYPGEKYEDYFIAFEKEETLRRHLLNDQGLLSGETELLAKRGNRIPLDPAYFDKDAIVLKYLQSERVQLGSTHHDRRIELAFEDFPFLGIWAKPNTTEYVCIEPWCGIAGSVGESGELKEKEGINKLAPGQSFERTYSITVL
ncbi:aldose 1-epimerase family protein [Pontibacter akesuensis]|uniref:Galactose mutarotase n=1 Tax=Pontibacter akesuensis TaxID=388950 RepID=A0A1I7JF95_9BACT|nr:aldose 1-epimerase family protein [Pontibacter akesuensis]GHA70365.1 galactose mutarotase [Pontibacter akesuensis]SFU83865.1 Galactose mutarotase [Pontibacter akesuensis]